MAVSVGIDLGTTYSAVAIVDEATNQPRIIPNPEGKHITPSVIQFIENRLVFGEEAEDAWEQSEPDCISSFKREMGETRPFCWVGGKPYTPEELSTLLLLHLKEYAEEALGEPISSAVITVPAYFYSREREATIRAANAAGIKVKKIIDEPNAAALAYGLTHWRQNANILVYDLGGGTFDVTLVRMGKDGDLSTINTRGNQKLGGRDWDSRLEDLILEKFAVESGTEFGNDFAIEQVVKGLSEGVKKRLTSLETVRVTASLPGIGDVRCEVNRGEFETRTVDLLEHTGDLCRAVLHDSGLTVRDVSDVLLVGGSTRMPQVSNYLQWIFGKRPITHVNPDEAVALGAAIQATKTNESYVPLKVNVTKEGKLVADRGEAGLATKAAIGPSKRLGSVGKISLRETTAHAMGIVAIDTEANRYYNEVIIPANHPRPIRAAKRFRFFTSPTAPRELEIHVLQGDSPDPLDCQLPYQYLVSGIEHVHRGEKLGTVIRVQYSYDENGIIQIQARQEYANVDLPIRREEVAADIARFGKPVVGSDADRHTSMASKSGGSGSKDMVHKYRTITFSNVEWEKYDNIAHHEDGSSFNEPKVHIVANKKNIEFHGYNISEMDEGVTYTINARDDFQIECDIDTSTISPHPGGHLSIALGIIEAKLDEHGGKMRLDGEDIATVDPRFNLKMSLTDGGNYEAWINGKRVGRKVHPTMGAIDVSFGFEHGGHCCHLLSHAYVSDIRMKQRSNEDTSEGAEVATWDD